jgi:Rieske Fe-S protein
MAQQRRTILTWLLGGGFTASIVSFVYPALRFLRPPAVPEASTNEVSAGKVGDFKAGTGRIVKFGSQPALLIRLAETDWRAFSAICTHLNCTVQYREAERQIWCACHNGFYDLNGKVVSGPPPKPLEGYKVHVRGEEVIIARAT